MDIVLYALTALLYGGLAVAGWRSHRHTVLRPALESVPALPAAAGGPAVAAFSAPGTTAVVTWKPQLSAVLADPNAQLVFDSSKIPGEILDLMVVKTDILNANPKLGKALIGAWYETLAVMFKSDAAGRAAQTAMAKASGTDLAGFALQLATTHIFATPADAYAFVTTDSVVKSMDSVRKFSFDHGILGQSASSVDAVGIQFPAGKSLGDNRNLKLRFDAVYTKMALDGAL